MILWTTLRKLVVGHAGSMKQGDVDRLLNICKMQDVSALMGVCGDLASKQLFDDADTFRCHSIIANFLKKYPFGKVSGLDPRRVAMERFEKAESLCRITNRRLTHYRQNEFRLYTKRPDVHWVLHSARQKISFWLGVSDSSEAEYQLPIGRVAELARHGPGSCIGVRHPFVSEVDKLSAGTFSMTARCRSLFAALLESDVTLLRTLSGLGPFDYGPSLPPDLVCQKRIEITNYNKITFVPKTAQTDRAIAIEPMFNVYFQLGVGSFLRERLRKNGLDLDFSWERNKALAKLGSLESPDRQISTIDLSMASDTLPIELVRDLLPPIWFDFLSRLRSPVGVLGKVKRTWAKFSSMGNGFTFELETMIFYALAKSVSQFLNADLKDVTVFGDDIVVPSKTTPLLFDVLKHCGFKVNYDKTFVEGPFRESCGGDYFKGAGCRPFYLKRKLENRQDLLFLRNGLYLLFYQEDGSMDPRGRDAIDFLDSRLPMAIQTHLRGPISGPVDGVLYSEMSEAKKSALLYWDRDLQVWKIPALRSRSLRFSGGSSTWYYHFIGNTKLAGRETPRPRWELRWTDRAAKVLDEHLLANRLSKLWSGLSSPGSRSYVTRTGEHVVKVKWFISENW